MVNLQGAGHIVAASHRACYVCVFACVWDGEYDISLTKLLGNFEHIFWADV